MNRIIGINNLPNLFCSTLDAHIKKYINEDVTGYTMMNEKQSENIEII